MKSIICIAIVVLAALAVESRMDRVAIRGWKINPTELDLKPMRGVSTEECLKHCGAFESCGGFSICRPPKDGQFECVFTSAGVDGLSKADRSMLTEAGAAEPTSAVYPSGMDFNLKAQQNNTVAKLTLSRSHNCEVYSRGPLNLRKIALRGWKIAAVDRDPAPVRGADALECKKHCEALDGCGAFSLCKPPVEGKYMCTLASVRLQDMDREQVNRMHELSADEKSEGLVVPFIGRNESDLSALVTASLVRDNKCELFSLYGL